MPDDVSNWTKIKRSLDYIKAGTGMIDAPGGKVKMSDVRAAHKKNDESFRNRQNKICKNFSKFVMQWEGFDGDDEQDASKVRSIVKGYFEENGKGEVCIVNSGKNTAERVEIKGPHGNWVTIWKA